MSDFDFIIHLPRGTRYVQLYVNRSPNNNKEMWLFENLWLWKVSKQMPPELQKLLEL